MQNMDAETEQLKLDFAANNERRPNAHPKLKLSRYYILVLGKIYLYWK